MNPIDWLKAIYEVFGTPYPRASLVAVIILSAILGAGVWLFTAKQVEKDRQAKSAPGAVTTGPASTSGDNSPAVTGSGNSVQYNKTEPKQ